VTLRDEFQQVASSVPFDSDNNAFVSDNVQGAIEESVLLAEGKPRAFIYFWEWNTNATPKFFYKFGQVRSDDGPFVVAVPSRLRELTCGGKLNNANANASFTIYKNDTGVAPTTFGSRAQVVSQGLTFIEGDFPYTGTTRVQINLVNNGPSLPLVFSEDIFTRIITVQLATNAGGVVTTTRTQLRDAFRLNNTISLLYAIDGTGGTAMTTENIVCSGGSVVEEIASVFMRAKSWGLREFNIQLNPGDFLYMRNDNQNVASFGNPDTVAYISFGVS
jgi:hypothetical protein